MSSLEKGALVSWLLSPVCSDLTTPITMTFQDTATFQDSVSCYRKIELSEERLED